jgi:hypothetical protein
MYRLATWRGITRGYRQVKFASVATIGRAVENELTGAQLESALAVEMAESPAESRASRRGRELRQWVGICSALVSSGGA